MGVDYTSVCLIMTPPSAGAKCEANTFDGERCLYAALSDSIKKMLKGYKMITSTTMRRGVYEEFLRK